MPWLGTIEERFWRKVKKTAKCWLWTGSRCPKDYGRFHPGKGYPPKGKATHTAWFLATGKWPKKHVLHKCDNPPCVRFDHLYQGTNDDNNMDKMLRGRAAKKLTPAKVRKIRYLAGCGWLQREIADSLEVSESMVGFVIGRRYWRHVR